MTIITGAGIHSEGGPKIKGAVQNWAKENNIKLTPDTEGAFKIKLK